MQSVDDRPAPPAEPAPETVEPSEPRVLDPTELAAAAGGAAKPGVIFGD